MLHVAEFRSVVGTGNRFLLSMMLVGGLFARVASADVLLHWLPSGDPTVVGYNVYVRAAGEPYETPLNVGLPGRAADGTLSYRVTQLPAATTRYFAVAGYGGDGGEGPLSNEVPLGPTNPCVLDQCQSRTSCTVLPLPDGSRCAEGASDPCSDLCGAGVCGSVFRNDLRTGRLLLAQGTLGVRLGGTAVFPATVGDALATSGVTVAIEGLSGPAFFETFVPSEALRVGANGGSFRYRAPRRTTTGLLRLSIRRSGDSSRMSVLAVVDGLSTDDLPDQVRWSVNVADRCASDVGMVCNRGQGRMSCS